MKHISFLTTILYFCGILIISYFVWHFMFGNSSIFKYRDLKNQISIYENKLNELRLLKANLHHKSRMLNPRNIDYDLLDEVARSSLGLLKSSEVILINTD